ncbi:MAG: ATP-binding protein [Anaerolineales bacterium]|nr:ATP-binding protein [Anaerolineales bacterium]
MKIAVASGKGGTGKTTVAIALALALVHQGRQVSYLDCDVEGPNAHLFLKPEIETHAAVNKLVPQVDARRCNACGRCAEVCQYHAIVTLGGKTLVFPELCHGCGSCTLECPQEAITEVPVQLGQLEAGPVQAGLTWGRGLLDVGEPMAVPVIRQLKAWRPNQENQITIWDAPPGTSCPVVETLRGADYLLLVTEPTPFGLHDLRLAAELARELQIQAGVIINRADIGNAQVEAFCQQAGMPVLLQIPFEHRIAAGLAQGQTLTEIKPEYITRFQDLFAHLVESQAVQEAQP